MSNINIKRFVDINIVQHTLSSVNATRDTVILLTDEGTNGQSKVYSSQAEWNADASVSNLDVTAQYIKVFFDNGGNKVRVIQGITDVMTVFEDGLLDNNEIVVAWAGDDYVEMKGVANNLNADNTVYGVNRKILLARTEDASASDIISNFAVKYSTIIGAEMTIAAYLSNINVYGIDTVQDYAFTKENITEENIDDSTYESIISNNMNVDLYLANAVRNLGGNLKDGKDIVNEYVLIILHQTLTDRLVNLLAQKLKGPKGLAAIHTCMAQELAKYVTNGYLTTSKVWTNPTLTTTYNNQTYMIIEENTPLLLGYQTSILPMSALTDEDKANRKTPPIYVILATSYGIRQITINGEVI